MFNAICCFAGPSLCWMVQHLLWWRCELMRDDLQIQIWIWWLYSLQYRFTDKWILIIIILIFYHSLSLIVCGVRSKSLPYYLDIHILSLCTILTSKNNIYMYTFTFFWQLNFTFETLYVIYVLSVNIFQAHVLVLC